MYPTPKETQAKLNAIEDLHHDTDAPISIWLGSLSDYNNGDLVGRWISLPTDEDALSSAMAAVTYGGKWDYFIADFESEYVKVGEYDDPHKLNEMAERIEELGDDLDPKILEWLMVDVGYNDFEDALEKVKEVQTFSTWQEAAYDYFDENLFSDVDEATRDRFSNYIDWDGVWTDLQHSATTRHTFTDGAYVFWD
jgi:hypothetical protein